MPKYCLIEFELLLKRVLLIEGSSLSTSDYFLIFVGTFVSFLFASYQGLSSQWVEVRMVSKLLFYRFLFPFQRFDSYLDKD